MLAKDILKAARYTLSDLQKDRWSDERLLKLLDEGIKEIAKKTTIFVETKIVVVHNLMNTLDLRDVSTKIVRVEYLDKPVPFMTMEEMDDRFGKNWIVKEGERLEAVVYTKQPNSTLRLYPILKNTINYNIHYNTLFGIVTDISYSDILPVMEDHYGDISGIPDDALIKVFYVRKHEDLTDINQELHIDELCELPLQHYVAGRALRDNQDTQNRAMGNEELQFYYALVDEYSIEKAQNFVRTVVETKYRPLGV